MEAEGRTNRHPEVSSDWSRNHYRNARPMTAIQRRMLLTPEDGGSHVRLSKKRKKQEGMRHDGVRSESEPSSPGEDERMTESLSNACPIHKKKKKNNRSDIGSRFHTRFKNRLAKSEWRIILRIGRIGFRWGVSQKLSREVSHFLSHLSPLWFFDGF